MSVLAIIFAVVANQKVPYIILALVCAIAIFKLIDTLKEKENAPEDSGIMVGELKKRIEAVNLWDK